METFLDQEFGNNTLRAYLCVAAVILVTLLFKKLISTRLARLLYKLVAKASKKVARQSFLDLVMQPLGSFLLLVVTIVALDRLNFPAALDFKIYRITFQSLLNSIADGTMVVVFIWLCLRVIDFVAMILEEKANLTQDQTDNQLIIFFKDFFKVLLIIMGILLLLRFSFNKNIGSLLTGLSIVGAAIALATRESMENLIASFIIFFDKPFITGDLVKVSGFTGVIEKIGLRSTRIRTTDKTYISVPNKQMVDTIVDNISLRTERRAEIRLELGLSASAGELKTFTAAVKDYLKSVPLTQYTVYFADTGKTAHIVVIEYFTAMDQSLETFNEQREAVNLEIIRLMEKANLSLAAASTAIHVRKQEPGAAL